MPRRGHRNWAVAERNGKTRQDPPGRVAPHNLEAEESLLGAMLLSADARNAVVGLVMAEDFFRPIHGDVFAAIAGLHESGEGVDPVTVDYELRNAGRSEAVGGVAALLTLVGNVPATSNAAEYAKIVRDHAVLRRLITVAGEAQDAAYGNPDDVAGAVMDAAARIEALLPGHHEGTQQLGESLPGWLDSLEDRFRSERGVGVPTCWRALDRLLVGLRAGQLVIVGGRPSVGKSQVMITLAHQVAAQTATPVLFYSIEMTREEVTDRIVAVAARVDREEIRRGKLHETSWLRLSNAMGSKLADLPLWIEHDPEGSVAGLRAAARRVERAGWGRPLVIVDYLQLMTVPRRGENRQAEVAELSRSLKRAAADWPIVAASQLSRKVDERADKRPVLSDLRESGSLEQDADVVMFVHRPDAYDRTDRPGEMDLIVAKQRNGPTGTAVLLHDAKTGVIRDRPDADAAEPLAMNMDS
jgi:replicative DNA helicase